MKNCEAMTSSTHSFAYSYGLVKKCFLKICETSKFHNFLIFQPIFIRFSLFSSENFTLSSEIKLDQLRTSPLSLNTSLMGKVFIMPLNVNNLDAKIRFQSVAKSKIRRNEPEMAAILDSNMAAISVPTYAMLKTSR